MRVSSSVYFESFGRSEVSCKRSSSWETKHGGTCKSASFFFGRQIHPTLNLEELELTWMFFKWLKGLLTISSITDLKRLPVLWNESPGSQLGRYFTVVSTVRPYQLSQPQAPERNVPARTSGKHIHQPNVPPFVILVEKPEVLIDRMNVLIVVCFRLAAIDEAKDDATRMPGRRVSDREEDGGANLKGANTLIWRL